MKILAFSFEAPCKLYGGGIGIIQSLSSLCQFAEVDYVGPTLMKTIFLELLLIISLFLKTTMLSPLRPLI